MENKRMANRQEEKSTQNAEDTVRRAGERSAEQTRRIGLIGGQMGEEAARVGANLLQEQAEMMQNAWQLGVDMASAIMGRSTDQLGRSFGLSGNESRKAVERSAKGAETMLYSASALTKGMNGLSREYFDLTRTQLQTQLDRMNELWACRTPQDFFALQADLVRDVVGNAFESGRKMADISVRLAGDAGKHISESVQRAA
jgi:phasin family protein